MSRVLRIVVMDDTTGEIFASVTCTDAAFVYNPRHPLIEKAFELLAKELGKHDAQQIPRPEENNGCDCARLEAAEGQQGVEDTEESREGVQSRGCEEGEA